MANVVVYVLAMSYGLLLSMLASNVRAAYASIQAILLPSLLLGGYLKNLSTINAYIAWLSNLSMHRYSFSILAMNELQRVQFDWPIQSEVELEQLSF